MISTIIEELEHHDQHSNIIYYLKNITSLNHLIDHKRRVLRLKGSKFCFINQGIGWRNMDGLILKCVDPKESKNLMDQFHKGICGGHHTTRTTTHKILRGGYYWSTIFSDVHKFVISSHPCQLFIGKYKLADIPLQPVVVEAPFQQWGLDFIGEFKDNSINGYKSILMSMDYFTKWVEAMPTKRDTKMVFMEFFEENIITRFRVPKKIISNNAKDFIYS
jgi:hypothetical protein